ncbi:hypothetical protein J2S49_000960 [Arcanobacterium wilhelmae]|uniref:TadE-like domain-containing protein n=1 Tax=Arcanobacterium wilhelmae TaxID=1803177 RepID=A0ABT9NAY8_9ACTO|nr:TadE family protein [Arcanobacterium wilhelmae]MDP9800884.1 hypothetical protein [Arcanobacterium wilhelmae]WFN90251.1 pilus assembly protein [Arcanobacterium wilhelmae]
MRKSIKSATRKSRERGASSLEFVGTFIGLLLATLVVIQLGIAGWAIMHVTDATRDGARLTAIGHNGELFISSRLPNSIAITRIECSSNTTEARCVVRAKVPSLLPQVSFGEFTRTVTMPQLH